MTNLPRPVMPAVTRLGRQRNLLATLTYYSVILVDPLTGRILRRLKPHLQYRYRLPDRQSRSQAIEFQTESEARSFIRKSVAKYPHVGWVLLGPENEAIDQLEPQWYDSFDHSIPARYNRKVEQMIKRRRLEPRAWSRWLMNLLRQKPRL